MIAHTRQVPAVRRESEMIEPLADVAKFAACVDGTARALFVRRQAESAELLAGRRVEQQNLLGTRLGVFMCIDRDPSSVGRIGQPDEATTVDRVFPCDAARGDIPYADPQTPARTARREFSAVA